MTYVIAEPCIDIKDRSCVDVCPVDCIHESERMLVICFSCNIVECGGRKKAVGLGHVGSERNDGARIVGSATFVLLALAALQPPLRAPKQ